MMTSTFVNVNLWSASLATGSFTVPRCNETTNEKYILDLTKARSYNTKNLLLKSSLIINPVY